MITDSKTSDTYKVYGLFQFSIHEVYRTEGNFDEGKI